MKRTIIGLAAALAAFSGGPAAYADTVKIGFLNTFSGRAAVFGKHQKDAFELALDHLGRKMGGVDVEMVYGDDQRKPDVARQEVDAMLKKHRVNFVTGITWSNILAAVQKPVVRSKTFLISTNAGWSGMAGKQCSPYFFSTSWNNDQTPESMGKLMNDESVDNVFLLAPNYQAGKDMFTGFQRFYKKNVVGKILFKLGQSDFQAELSQVRAKKPGALFGFFPGGMGIAFVKQYKAAGLDKTTPLYTVFTVDHMTLKGHGDAAVGTFHTNFWNIDSDNAANQRFIKDFVAKYGYHPSHYSAQAYDSAMLIDSAVRAVGGDLSNKDGMRDAMRKADFASIRGPFQYNTNHIPIQNFYKREVIADGSGGTKIVTRGVVFENHKDAYHQDCKMKW
ncbi:MAG: ABC transporter substrate-binding protein [Pseudomonadota bacterium]